MASDPKTVCLLNDSFPPQYDGVAMATANYAKELMAMGHKPVVVVPANPGAADENYCFPIQRYPSVSFRKMEGYMAGIPFSPETVSRIAAEKVQLLHCHCPIVSGWMARQIRQVADAPIVMTYHTKFDIDIANLTKNKALQETCRRALVENIAASDAVWAVSRGAGENLRALGYEGEYTVMPNGVDMPKGRLCADAVQRATAGYDLPADVPVYLFAGRLMWYKGIRIVFDALAGLEEEGKDFRFVILGGGNDRLEMEEYAAKCGICSKCIFVGPVLDRELMRAWYCRADLFLFPSTFDTNGLVVREAAAASLPAVLVKGSCAAEGVTDGRNGFLISETPVSLFACLMKLYGQKQTVRRVGEAAAEELYLSWKDAVAMAEKRYGDVIETYKSGKHPPHNRIRESMFRANAELMEKLSELRVNRLLSERHIL